MLKKYRLFVVLIGIFYSVQASYWQVPQGDANNVSLQQLVFWRNEAEVIHYIKNTPMLHVNNQDSYGDTALIIASRCDRINIVKALLQKGAILGIRNIDGRDAFKSAPINSVTSIELQSHIIED
jgi:ankyrin repeat protein